MSKPLSFEHIQSIAESRNHTVISTEGYTCVKSKIKFFCSKKNIFFNQNLTFIVYSAEFVFLSLVGIQKNFPEWY